MPVKTVRYLLKGGCVDPIQCLVEMNCSVDYKNMIRMCFMQNYLSKNRITLE